MATGILMTNCVGAHIESCSIIGMDNAFEIYDSEDVLLKDVNISATRTAVKGERIRRLSADNFTHSSIGWAPRPKPLAIAIWRIVNGYV